MTFQQENLKKFWRNTCSVSHWRSIKLIHICKRLDAMNWIIWCDGQASALTLFLGMPSTSNFGTPVAKISKAEQQFH
ncbi:hypothetical protein QE152_g30783 [Popillia japonica]|uniref:Uncharacterized protein n=1 Tax=Popillia japonica TaxID=7064 RepID=A0AAW1JD17_POPJA